VFPTTQIQNELSETHVVFLVLTSQSASCDFHWINLKHLAQGKTIIVFLINIQTSLREGIALLPRIFHSLFPYKVNMLNIPMTCFVVSHNTSITAAATS
jgi:hypothetical protein